MFIDLSLIILPTYSNFNPRRAAGGGATTDNYKMSLGREKSQFQRPRHRYEYNIKMDLKCKKSEDVGWIQWLTVSFFRGSLRMCR